MSSAGNTRGLIEAPARPRCSRGSSGLPRGIPAASLKRASGGAFDAELLASSAGNTRGLIEACRGGPRSARLSWVFRGEYPRPHVDRALVEDMLRVGGTVYRTHAAGYLLVRHTEGHTWQRDDADFLGGAECVHPGWQPALAGLGNLPPPIRGTGP